MNTILTTLVVLLALCVSIQGEEIPTMGIVPRPTRLVTQPGAVTITASTPVLADGSSRQTARQLVQFLQTVLGAELPIGDLSSIPVGPVITLQEEPQLTGVGPEGYHLVIAADGIHLRAATQAGLFYGVQSLRQLAPVTATPSWRAPYLVIDDQPRFRWRGFMLDCGHAFHSVTAIKRLLDAMASYKLNTLHWHLTDNCTWALEIAGHPELTAAGVRVPEVLAPGYFTQQEAREVVRYAAERHIRVVPEIDVPGHSTIALRAKPALRCTAADGSALHGDPGHPIKSFCVGNEATYTFLEEVFDQVMDIFPGTYIHIGTDEVGKKAWEACPNCQSRMKSEGLATVQDLQGYFSRRITAFIASKGRRAIGWQEMMQGGLGRDAAVMSWTSMEAGIAAAKLGHDVVMNPQAATYFSTGGPTIFGIYAYDPSAPGQLSADEATHILGGQAAVWGGLDGTFPEKTHDQAVFPRLLPLSEALWTPRERRDYDDFLVRLRAHLPRLAAQGFALGRFQTAPGIGTWEFTKRPTSPVTQEWPITIGAGQPGRYEIRFITEKGDRLMVRSAEILHHGTVVAATPVQGEGKDFNPWRFELPADAALPLTLRAVVLPKSWDRRISRGTILIERLIPPAGSGPSPQQAVAE